MVGDTRRMDSHISLVGEIDWPRTVQDELTARNRFLPPLWGDVPLRASVEPVAEILRSALGRAFVVDPEVTVLARKKSRGARPLSRLGLRERVLYRGLADLVASRADVPGRDDAAYRNFESAPLSVADVKYVLKADIAAYYEYVDHERLVDEVIAQTASDRAIGAIAELLCESSGKSFGLPQMTDASDLLAEIYIDPMRRQLVRAGYSVSRFADDFRFSCRSYEEALSAWDAADEAARSLGLVLSETKTRVVGIDKYRASVPEHEEDEEEAEAESDSLWALADLSEYLDEDLRVWSMPATGAELEEVDHPALEEVDDEADAPSEDAQEVASSFIDDLVSARRNDQAHVVDSHLESSVLLNRAIKILVRSRNPVALGHAPALIVYEPVSTPYIAAYLRSCSEHDRSDVIRSLGRISRSGITSPWQQVWISFVAGDIDRRPSTRVTSHVKWLQSLTRSMHPAVAAEAMLALARRGFTTANEVTEVLERLPRVHKSTAVLALAALGDEKRALAAADDLLDQLRVRWGLEMLS